MLSDTSKTIGEAKADRKTLGGILRWSETPNAHRTMKPKQDAQSNECD
jgi:hypothetical protein